MSKQSDRQDRHVEHCCQGTEPQLPGILKAVLLGLALAVVVSSAVSLVLKFQLSAEKAARRSNDSDQLERIESLETARTNMAETLAELNTFRGHFKIEMRKVPVLRVESRLETRPVSLWQPSAE